MYVDLKKEVVLIGDDLEYKLIGLDDVGYYIDENASGKWRVWNTKEVISIVNSDGLFYPFVDVDFHLVCKAIEDELSKNLPYI